MFYSFDMSMDTERIDLLVECEDSSLLDIRGTVFIQFVLCSFRSLRPSKRIRHLSHSSDRYLLKSVSVKNLSIVPMVEFYMPIQLLFCFKAITIRAFKIAA